MIARAGSLCVIPLCLCFSSVLLAQPMPGKPQDPAARQAMIDAIKSSNAAKQSAIQADKSAKEAKASAFDVLREKAHPDEKKSRMGGTGGGGTQEGLDDPCRRNPNLPHCKGA